MNQPLNCGLQIHCDRRTLPVPCLAPSARIEEDVTEASCQVEIESVTRHVIRAVVAVLTEPWARERGLTGLEMQEKGICHVPSGASSKGPFTW